MTITLRKDVSATESEDGMVLLDERTGRYFQLNPTAAFVLKSLIDGATSEQAADALTVRYEVPLDQAVSDTRTLISALLTAKLAS